MSALAKSFLSWHDRFTVHHDGRVWVDEKLVEKWVELARRELSSADKRELAAQGLGPRAEGSSR